MPVKPVLLGRLTHSFLFLCIFCFSALSQIPDISWEKQLNLRTSHFFTDVLELPDGNLILLGAVEKTGEKASISGCSGATVRVTPCRLQFSGTAETIYQ
jgi:hypothetical protein